MPPRRRDAPPTHASGGKALSPTRQRGRKLIPRWRVGLRGLARPALVILFRRRHLRQRADDAQERAELAEAHAVAVEELGQGKLVVQGVTVRAAQVVGQFDDQVDVRLLQRRQYALT